MVAVQTYSLAFQVANFTAPQIVAGARAVHTLGHHGRNAGFIGHTVIVTRAGLHTIRPVKERVLGACAARDAGVQVADVILGCAGLLAGTDLIPHTWSFTFCVCAIRYRTIIKRA